MAKMRHGVHKPLEAMANDLLRETFRGETSHSVVNDVLSPWKLAARRRREVYVASGRPDPSFRKGLYRREANRVKLHLNSRDGADMKREKIDPISVFDEEVSW